MADALADISMTPRYSVRTQAAFVRSLKFLHSAEPGAGDGQGQHLRIPRFNIPSIYRIHDLNPPIYVCALSLLEQEVEEDPSVIRASSQFRNLVDRLGLQPTTQIKDVRKTYRASLVLLEVFVYMILIHRARAAEDELVAAAREATAAVSNPDELLG